MSDRVAAWEGPLSPLAGLVWAAATRPDQVAVVHGERRYRYSELEQRCRRLAGALRARGVSPGDRVAILAPNSPALLEAHFGVPAAGAVLVTLNVRLHAAELAAILARARPRLLLVDAELAGAVAGFDVETVLIEDTGAAEDPYERLLAQAEPARLLEPPASELAPLAINYTSGTTGEPKGAVYTHRGAALQMRALVECIGLDQRSVHLWTLPMFHCNGWCLTWAVTAVAARHVCLRAVEAGEIWRLLEAERITHYSGAPTVHLALVNAAQAHRLEQVVCVPTGGSPPSPTLMEQMEALNLHPLHLYGLTETYGPHTRCTPRPEWADADPTERARLYARQGEVFAVGEEMRVVDEAMAEVPSDGETVGEVVMRGNTVASGYFEDPERTEEAFGGGWFRSGDLAVRHPDGYIELRDRSKDIIITGGENVSSIEIEQVLVRHPAVLDAAVVPVPDPKWGERPRAHIELKDGCAVDAEELRVLCREHLAGFKCPDEFAFGPLPRTGTGKVQKFQLRDRA